MSVHADANRPESCPDFREEKRSASAVKPTWSQHSLNAAHIPHLRFDIAFLLLTLLLSFVSHLLLDKTASIRIKVAPTSNSTFSQRRIAIRTPS